MFRQYDYTKIYPDNDKDLVNKNLKVRTHRRHFWYTLETTEYNEDLNTNKASLKNHY